MTKEIKYICQTYQMGSQGQLQRANQYECSSEIAAGERARRLFESGSYKGVDSILIAADPELGEYDEPIFLVRYGQVPQDE